MIVITYLYIYICYICDQFQHWLTTAIKWTIGLLFCHSDKGWDWWLPLHVSNHLFTAINSQLLSLPWSLKCCLSMNWWFAEGIGIIVILSAHCHGISGQLSTTQPLCLTQWVCIRSLGYSKEWSVSLLWYHQESGTDVPNHLYGHWPDLPAAAAQPWAPPDTVVHL